jgi:hypothetical protein
MGKARSREISERQRDNIRLLLGVNFLLIFTYLLSNQADKKIMKTIFH